MQAFFHILQELTPNGKLQPALGRIIDALVPLRTHSPLKRSCSRRAIFISSHRHSQRYKLYLLLSHD